MSIFPRDDAQCMCHTHETHAPQWKITCARRLVGWTRVNIRCDSSSRVIGTTAGNEATATATQRSNSFQIALVMQLTLLRNDYLGSCGPDSPEIPLINICMCVLPTCAYVSVYAVLGHATQSFRTLWRKKNQMICSRHIIIQGLTSDSVSLLPPGTHMLLFIETIRLNRVIIYLKRQITLHLLYDHFPHCGNSRLRRRDGAMMRQISIEWERYKIECEHGMKKKQKPCAVEATNEFSCWAILKNPPCLIICSVVWWQFRWSPFYLRGHWIWSFIHES